MADSPNGIPSGSLQPPDTWGEYNQILFVVQQALSKMQTATLVRVLSCTNDGDVSAVGSVNVVPMVNQIDAAGEPTPHVAIFNVPYLRVQGGANAVIIDPQPGDIGICVFASRDISKIKATKQPGNPGSLRQYSFSDGMYLGGVLNGVPTQYVRFSTAGVAITSTTKITLTAPTVEIAGAISQTGGGDVVFSGDASAPEFTAGSIALTTHKHGGVQTGGGQTTGPVP
jgi:hypothetical protein